MARQGGHFLVAPGVLRDQFPQEEFPFGNIDSDRVMNSPPPFASIPSLVVSVKVDLEAPINRVLFRMLRAAMVGDNECCSQGKQNPIVGGMLAIY